ncbi:nodulation protein NodZ [Roseobacter sp. N2S]|uniref:NodZ family protein n=1 Tax=Roseobacter sp. N2S TaxID=2663844 RepID=UPI00285EF3C4|nr:nodulation protein NodZ [Roseobacter sp. N2S]MDR6267659.1 hypothetical protein [Roseobacter sp. N2S]
MEKTLLIKGKGGLGNRILSAVCGLVFADLTGRAPVIDWRDGSYAPAGENAYPLLFKPPIMQQSETYDDDTSQVSPAIWTGYLARTPQEMIDDFIPDSHSSPIGYRRLCTDLRRLDAPENLAIFWAYLPKFGRLARHMRRDPRFVGRSQAAIIGEYLERYFTPNDRVLSEVGSMEAQLGSPCIGVHIRYTDRKVPLHRIKDTLRKRLRSMPDARIFLATDNSNVQTEMMTEFTGIHHIPKYLAEDGARLHWPSSVAEKVREAENALIDMWLLSRCDHLIYSRHSTFSVTASYLGNMSRTQLDDVDRFSPKIVAKRLIQNYI